MVKKIYSLLATPEENGKKIGLFRIIAAVLGGVAVAYLGMTALALVLPGKLQDSAVLALLYNTFAWSIAALWIAVSPTKLSALLRSTIPPLVFLAIIYSPF